MEMGYAFFKNFFFCIFFAFYSRSEVLILALQIKAFWVVSAYFCCSSPHFIVGSVSQTGTKYRHSPKSPRPEFSLHFFYVSIPNCPSHGKTDQIEGIFFILLVFSQIGSPSWSLASCNVEVLRHITVTEQT